MFPFGFGAKKDRGTGSSVLAAREMKQEPKNESGGRGRGKKETLADKPLDFENLLLTPFFARCLTLVPRSLLLSRTETIATQASMSSKSVRLAWLINRLLCWLNEIKYVVFFTEWFQIPKNSQLLLQKFPRKSETNAFKIFICRQEKATTAAVRSLRAN